MENLSLSSHTLHPIGVFKSDQIHPYEAGRQPDAHHSEGVIELISGHNFEQALEEIETCPRLWILFSFHHNTQWRPQVLPPRGRDTKIGVFATRSPYRPNALGMSCVRFLRREGLKLYVAEADLLNGSPVFDIKPYVAYADSFPGVQPSWLESAQAYDIIVSPLVEEQTAWLENHGVTQLRGFLRHQLEYEPTHSKKKRVRAESSGESYILAYRTWRCRFQLRAGSVHLISIFSGYSEQDLLNTEDPYSDKGVHRLFLNLWRR
ncbi:MAG: tRNA (N6-threonylcarbamoyladenosine(37)-N6)-methyltransferase TrmO [Bdellovibrio sp.]